MANTVQIEAVDSIVVYGITTSCDDKKTSCLNLIIKDEAGNEVDLLLSSADVAILQTLLKNGG